MSFDFMVFDDAVPPRSDNGFMDWYRKEVGFECETLVPSSNDSAIAECDPLRSFYAEMREMFTPLNGPDQVVLEDGAPQVRILRTCDYDFRPHSLYMSFRWPASDMARSAAMTFAKNAGLGMYHVSSPHGFAMFADGKKVWPSGRYSSSDAAEEPK